MVSPPSRHATLLPCTRLTSGKRRRHAAACCPTALSPGSSACQASKCASAPLEAKAARVAGCLAMTTAHRASSRSSKSGTSPGCITSAASCATSACCPMMEPAAFRHLACTVLSAGAAPTRAQRRGRLDAMAAASAGAWPPTLPSAHAAAAWQFSSPHCRAVFSAANVPGAAATLAASSGECSAAKPSAVSAGSAWADDVEAA